MAISEGFIPIQPTKVVDVGLGLLERETMLTQTVWRDAAGDFRGVKDETISIRVPAYAVATKRDLRSADARVQSTLYQRKVDVTLTHDLQVDVPITDEELTLDIENYTREITAPSIAGIVRGYEEEVASLMQDATYEVTLDWDESEPYDTLIDARAALNDASVPMTNRFLVVGSGFEAQLLKSEKLSDVDRSGSPSALRDASVGRIAGFDVLVSNFLAPEEAYAYHRTAYALNTRAPFVPQGVAFGASAARNGFAIRVMQHVSPDAQGSPINIAYHDAWVGTNIVEDHGEIDENGKFIPAVDPDLTSGSDKVFVRAVKISSNGS